MNSSIRNQVSEQEWQLRVELAACYRLVAEFGWDDLIFTHISVRVPGPDNHFLINPYGMMFDEITASDLIKIDQNGNKLQETPHSVNHAGFIIHSCIHEARHDVGCIIHTHTRAGVAVSAQKEGILPISQQSTYVLASLAYHDYEGVAVREDEQPRLQQDLGDANFLVLRNHGLLTVGETVADAFLSMYALEATCQIQLAAQSGGNELIHIEPKIVSSITEAVKTQGVNGSIVWPALLRKLDRIDPRYKD
ncbi:class II aldolase/adducin family protein [Vibrio sp. B1FLJ16]|uniref:class II aldolase/adducin family protein n=1 Tax=Vibrio sp. B1FLJ16 TaxID=2751178 RepID=UPI0015F659C7|nr:class II aldolase/adducin family protein [Vibrio sp. B1FLJ16]CAD7821215.1 Class II Aldolase and Adducin N-terminal domain [Vibrio sp. B1FLJ16]CAE6945628.1 Class II Aldolase and Adducin N-terminal domain [Vibrio sp. B1FLJ16]